MAFQQGLSGLNASSKALDVTSNNIANASTVGFKGAATHFADVYAASLSGGGASQVGIGTSAAAIVQQYTQGNITTTSNSLDVAINGNGFFRMSQDGAVSYSRNGQFHIDANGFLVNDTQDNLTGYMADTTGKITPTTPTALQISTASIPPKVTSQTNAALQLDSTQSVKTWAAPATATEAPDPKGYNFSTALTVYDTLGNPHTMTMYFVKGAPTAAELAGNPTATPPIPAATGAWDVHYQLDGISETGTPASAGPPPVAAVPGHGVTPSRLTFDNTGKLVSPAFAASPTLSFNLANVMAANGNTNSAKTPLDFKINFSDSTQFGAKFSVNELTQDGYTSGNLAGLSIGPDGVIQGNYSNGQTKNLAQIVLANFTNPNGLMSVGNNAWVETAASGQPKVGTPDSGTLGVLQSGAVEESNVDLTAELVNMIVQQRNYQANAQSIKTQDQIMQTLVNIR
ncbi:MAG: flagellar hook protein FlgE [Dechloromonas agitata]|uniref:Flagellar hook protein FlgE n=1 Tax=Dechloromonas agitata TaxID=73030 RepID=A0A930G0W1_9RHOO|nr:flagellar hook protein FlgE [Dechloromonas agitata]